MAVVVGFFKSLSDQFWNDRIWFPENISWADIKSTDEVQYPDFSDLYLPIPFAIVLLIARHVVERYAFAPLGRFLGLKDVPTKHASPNPLLEKAFLSNAKPSHREIQGLAKQLDWTERQVERWIRQRRDQMRPNLLTKFKESGWRFTYYFSIFIYGLVILWDKPWFEDTRHCWNGYPYQPLDREVWWYYIVELSFYWSLTISQFMDVQRKDFWQMFLHHVATILLMCFSWADNFVRIGTLVLLVHDAADHWLEAAKMAKYVKRKNLCNILFIIFTLVWFATRIVLFPVKIIYSTMIYAPGLLTVFPAYYVFNSLLSMLQVLHIIWSCMILRIAFKAVITGKTEDVRSDSDEDYASDTDFDFIVNNINKIKAKGN